MQNALEHNPWDYQEFMDSSPEGSVNAPSGVQPNPDSGPTGKDPLENILSMGSFLPGLGGDFLGPLSDLRAMQQDPNKRTLANIALFGVGALPAVPSLMWMMNKATDAPIHRGIFGNQSGALGYHGTPRNDFSTEEMKPFSHWASDPEMANELTGLTDRKVEHLHRLYAENKSDDYFIPYSGTNILKADLDIKKPLKIIDEGQNHEPWDFVIATYDAGEMTDEQFKAFEKIRLQFKNDPKKIHEYLTKFLTKKGYDGFLYENISEGKDLADKKVLVPFFNSQIKSGFKGK